jgi:hypothetical protein
LIDEITKWFRATIQVLKNREGLEKTSHEYKTGILWEAFKDRLGTNEFSEMHFDHNGLIQVEAGLDGLQELFTTEEINRIVKNLPSRKSPEVRWF